MMPFVALPVEENIGRSLPYILRGSGCGKCGFAAHSRCKYSFSKKISQTSLFTYISLLMSTIAS